MLLVVFKTMALWGGDERCNDLTRFWGRVFGINFVLGVVTGIPMEFQFGTNWARFSAYAGGVVGLRIQGERPPVRRDVLRPREMIADDRR